jgi:hydrogenase expression/formation protein HypC
MCLAIPALVKSMDGYLAEVEIGGLTRQASLQLTPEARVGDYVLLHTGYAISIIDQKEAQETLKLLEEIAVQPDDYRQG